MLALSAVGCARQPDTAAATDFFPLHPDDTWVYDVSRPLRNVHTRMTVRARGERYVNALRRRCRLVEESYAAGEALLDSPLATAVKPEIYPIAYYRENGFLYRALSLEYKGDDLEDVGLGSAEERFLPEGLERNPAWDSVTKAYDLGGGSGYDVHQTHRAAPERSNVEVPAGRFGGCIRVDTVALHSSRREGKAEGDPVVLYYSDWYAPNVGLVRTVQSSRPDGGPPLSQIELLAYDVEGAHR
jgi:hypothetical protein